MVELASLASRPGRDRLRYGLALQLSVNSLHNMLKIIHLSYELTGRVGVFSLCRIVT